MVAALRPRKHPWWRARNPNATTAGGWQPFTARGGTRAGLAPMSGECVADSCTCKARNYGRVAVKSLPRIVDVHKHRQNGVRMPVSGGLGVARRQR